MDAMTDTSRLTSGNGVSSISQSQRFATQIRCSRHPEEYIERICRAPRCGKNLLLCYECTLDDVEHVKEHRGHLVSVGKFIDLVAAEYVEKSRTDHVINEMPAEVEELLEGEETNRCEFARHVDEQKQRVRREVATISDRLALTLQEISKQICMTLDEQLALYRSNFDFFKIQVSERYSVSLSLIHI
eukprot:TRINITY_DN21082_c0_g1_i1.p1 TRINITY_DN21082_c0_g1~~TRINITY_DN21082_c0_g1_i1.p1  ORF type:complete len:187 (-),score=44.60 TRINITY_DN21082_c0_g1_i1:34-594(-)